MTFILGLKPENVDRIAGPKVREASAGARLWASFPSTSRAIAGRMRFPIHELGRAELAQFPVFQSVPLPPTRLFAQGRASALDLLLRLPERGFGVVGTRHPLARSCFQLRRWISDLGGSGLVVVSGFATGIDAEGHAAALSVGLPTVAILGAGLDIRYPVANADLRARILESGGLLLSEFPLGATPVPHQFLLRNRLIAGLSTAVLVVEAAARSGALNTAKWAADLGRICLSVPCLPGDSRLAGNQRLLDDGGALAFWGAHSLGAIWLELAVRPRQRFNRQVETRSEDEDEGRLLEAVRLLTLDRGGVSLIELQDFAAAALNWDSERFFLFLQKMLAEQRLFEKKGLILKNQT